MQFAILYPLLYRILNKAFPACLWSGLADRANIALTFDDGPHPKYTPNLLKVLDNYQVSATFFCLGNCVDKEPSLTREIYQRGHWIGLHGYYHRSFPWMTPQELQESLRKTSEAIGKACELNPQKIRDVRPPNGLFTPHTLRLFQQWNYRPVMWSVVPEDWTLPSISTVMQRVLNQVKNGSLIVLHDGYYGGEQISQTVEQLIPRLQEEGYSFVTVEQLWQERFKSNICTIKQIK
jgi:peptidoglycan/xylan/chitin deacetylase (PgdA/CDA1 family)